MDQIMWRIPEFERAEIRQMVNGAESFTPDEKSIVGTAPNVHVHVYISSLTVYVQEYLCCTGKELLCGCRHEFQWNRPFFGGGKAPSQLDCQGRASSRPVVYGH